MVDSMDKMNDYGMVIEVLAGRLAATVASIQRMKCQHCQVAVVGDIRLKSDMVVMAAAKSHHATCTARPLEVGDYVRFCTNEGGWYEGELLEASGDQSSGSGTIMVSGSSTVPEAQYRNV